MKRIVIYSAATIFPITGMHQVRILNQIKGLSKMHLVTFMVSYNSSDVLSMHQDALKPYCERIVGIRSVSQRFLFRLLRRIIIIPILRIFSYPLDYFNLSNVFISWQINKALKKIPFDFVISHYWYASGFLKRFKLNALRIVDTHYVVQENVELANAGFYNHLGVFRVTKELKTELRLQNQIFSNTDYLIVNSRKQKDLLIEEGIYPDPNILYVPNGQDLSQYLRIPLQPRISSLNLLFYGALSNQFNLKALHRFYYRLYPLLIALLPQLNVMIVGANPPEWIKTVAESNPNFKVTGFVDDVTTVFGACFACVIPLDSGSGFRGRVVELLASGIPIVGTSNALQSIDITHNVNGFIHDTDSEIVDAIFRLATDNELRFRISSEGRNLAQMNYSIDSTFGVLSNFLNKL